MSTLHTNIYIYISLHTHTPIYKHISTIHIPIYAPTYHRYTTYLPYLPLSTNYIYIPHVYPYIPLHTHYIPPIYPIHPTRTPIYPIYQYIPVYARSTPYVPRHTTTYIHLIYPIICTHYKYHYTILYKRCTTFVPLSTNLYTYLFLSTHIYTDPQHIYTISTPLIHLIYSLYTPTDNTYVPIYTRYTLYTPIHNLHTPGIHTYTPYMYPIYPCIHYMLYIHLYTIYIPIHTPTCPMYTTYTIYLISTPYHQCQPLIYPLYITYLPRSPLSTTYIPIISTMYTHINHLYTPTYTCLPHIYLHTLAPLTIHITTTCPHIPLYTNIYHIHPIYTHIYQYIPMHTTKYTTYHPHTPVCLLYTPFIHTYPHTCHTCTIYITIYNYIHNYARYAHSYPYMYAPIYIHTPK